MAPTFSNATLLTYAIGVPNKAIIYLNKLLYPLEDEKTNPRNDLSRHSVRSTFFNLMSIVLMIIAGFILNVFTKTYYGTSSLGIFTMSITFHIILSQISSLGIHFSILKKFSVLDELKELNSHLWASFFTVLLSSSVVCFIFYISANKIAQFYSMPNLKNSIQNMMYATWVFSFNKVLLNAINAKELMSSYGIAQIVRYSLLSLALIILSFYTADSSLLPLGFLISEAVVFVYCVFILKKIIFYGFPRFKKLKQLFLHHSNFGIRGFSSGLMIEVNSRVAIIVLGYFADEVIIGYYSAAYLFVEGTLQIFTMLRNFNAPSLSKYLNSKNYDRIKEKFKTFKYRQYFFASTLMIISLVFFSLYFFIVFRSPEYIMVTISSLFILYLGQFIFSPYFSFDNILILSNFPGLHSLYLIASSFINISLNILLIPILQSANISAMVSAAFATSVAQVAGLSIYKYLVKKKTNLTLS